MPSSSTKHEAVVYVYSPRGRADRELEWFFTMADSAMGERSNFLAAVHHAGGGEPVDGITDDRAEAAHAHRKVLDWIRALDDFDAGVLQAAYLVRPWPVALRTKFGRLTGVVVRIAAHERATPASAAALDALEKRTATELDLAVLRRDPSLARFQTAATPLLRRAFDAYVAMRGGADRPVPEGVS